MTAEATDAATDRRLSVAEVAYRLGLSKSQIHTMCREGVFGHNRYGDGPRRSVRIPESIVAAYLKATYVEPVDPEGAVA